MEILHRKLQALFIQGSIDASKSGIPGRWETPIIQGQGLGSQGAGGREGKCEGAGGKEHRASSFHNQPSLGQLGQ